MRTIKERGFSKGEFVSWAIILSVAAVVGVCCMMVPWLDDDLIYQYNCRWFNAGVLIPIKSFFDLFESQYYHYLGTNGRFVAHWLVQLYDGLLGQTAFALTNAIVYILFIRMIMRTCGIKKSNWEGVLTVACLVLTCQCLTMTPAFQMYIWMYLLVLSYLWILLHYRTRKWWMLILLCVFSLICGNAHESLNPGVCVGVMLYFVLNYRKITLQQWLMFGFFVLGLLILVVSPGTQYRMEGTVSTLEYWILAVYNLKNGIPAFYILVSVMLYKTVIQKESLIRIIKDNTLWWGIWATCFALILYFGFSGGRADLGEEFAAIILTLKILKRNTFTPFWLTLLSVSTVVFLYAQISKANETIQYLDEIKQKTIYSTDDIIYIDLSYSAPIAGLERYCGLVLNTNFNEKSPIIKMENLTSKYYSSKWGVNHGFRLYPTAMRPYIESKADTTDGNSIVEFAPGCYLIVQNKKHPAKFYVTYERNIPLFKKKYPPQEFSISGQLFEDEYWKAEIVTKDYYRIDYPATFTMVKPE